MDHRPTYPVEVKYLDGTEATIEFPRMSSEVFFDVISEIDTTKGILEIKIFNAVVKQMAPELMKKITLNSALNLAKKFMEMEEDNLGEVLGPAATTDGQSETPESLPASSSTT